MKQAITMYAGSSKSMPRSMATAQDKRPSSLITRFGEVIDVRNRGTLRVGRTAGDQRNAQEPRDAPAVVRIWTDDHCRELSSHQARALAAQLLDAANLADSQNNH